MFKLIGSTKDNIMSTEQFLEKTEKAMNEFPGSIVIFDSFSDLSSAKEKTGEYGSGYGGIDSRKLEGEFARRITPLLSVNDCTVIGIAHVTPNINSVGSSTKISKALEYKLDIRLSLKKSYPQGDWMVGDKLIGQKVSLECITSALGAPGKSGTIWHKYGEGFSEFAEIAELACDLNLIKRKGAGWFEIEKHEKKTQGFDNLCELLKGNKEIYEEILKEVNEVLN
jgi:RecA/RadA recombinase